MIVYPATKQQFVDYLRANAIANITPHNVLHVDDIPISAVVSIEYNIPLTNRRVDSILTGKDANRQDTAIIVELKQWQEAFSILKSKEIKEFDEYRTQRLVLEAWDKLKKGELH